MRLSKRIAAVALAAVMSVSMLTACGGGGGSSAGGNNGTNGGNGNGGNGSSISGDINGGNGSNNGGSGNNDGNGGNGSNTGNGGTGTGGSGENGSGSNGGNVINGIATEVSNPKDQPYASSKTAKFFSTKEYTMEAVTQFNDRDETGHFKSASLISTDGNRTYNKSKASMFGFEENEIDLTDKSTKQEWIIDLDDGTYSEKKLENTNNATGDLEPIYGQKMKKGTYTVNGVSYEAESQSYTETTDGIPVTITMIYCYSGNTLKYMIGVGSASYDEAGQHVDYAEETMRVEITKYEAKANASLLDFESILKNYKPEDDS